MKMVNNEFKVQSSLICRMLKNSTNELIHRREIELQMWKINLRLQDRRGEGMNWETWIDI